jgi:transposase
MLSMYNFEKIRKLYSEGKNKSQIAKELGINWKTVDKYLRSNTPPSYTPRSRVSREDLFIEFLPRVNGLLEAIPDLSAREIFEFLSSEGYRGSERTVNRRVSELREKQSPKERFFRQEYTPGEQSQFDFKEKVILPFKEDLRVVYLHVCTLPFSGTNFVRGYPSTNFECFMDGVHHFFSYLGGQTKNIRIDNLSACVSKVLKGSERKWTAAFARAMNYYGFGVLPCSPGRGNEKGDVERDIRTLINRIRHQVKIQNKVFKSWKDLNQWLNEFCNNFQSESSRVKLEEEKKFLEVLACYDENIVCRSQIAPASSFGTVRILRSAYSVPDRFIGLQLKVVPGAYELKIYHGRELVACHPRKPEEENSILLEHILPSLVRKPQAMVRWAHKEILFPNIIFKKYYEKLVGLDPSSAEREFLKSINLIHFSALSDIAAGMELVMEHHKDNFFGHLKELLLNERRPNNVIDITKLYPIKPNLNEYDSFIPQHQKKENV